MEEDPDIVTAPLADVVGLLLAEDDATADIDAFTDIETEEDPDAVTAPLAVVVGLMLTEDDDDALTELDADGAVVAESDSTVVADAFADLDVDADPEEEMRALAVELAQLLILAATLELTLVDDVDERLAELDPEESILTVPTPD